MKKCTESLICYKKSDYNKKDILFNYKCIPVLDLIPLFAGDKIDSNVFVCSLCLAFFCAKSMLFFRSR